MGAETGPLVWQAVTSVGVAIADAIALAERIMVKIDNRWRPIP